MRIFFLSLMIGLGVVQTGLGGTEAMTLVHGGRTRPYRVHLPPSYREGDPMALVFALHGYSGTAASFEKRTDFSRIADREGFIVVYPNAIPFGPKQKQLWNGGGIYEIWWAGQVDDVSFFVKLIDTVSSHYTIDPDRIFVFGNSSGGFMAHHLGARLPGRIAAIAPWGSLLAFNDFVAGPPVSVIHFHGEQDDKVLYNGLPNWNFFGVEHGIRLWATRNRCKSAPIVIRDDPNVLVQRWAAPKGTGDVVLYKLKNHGHSMPTPPNCNLAEIAWKFFNNHPRSNVKTPWPEESQSPTIPFAVGPYLGQVLPGSTAQVFAPGLICKIGYGQWESNGTFSADGKAFCYKQRQKVYITENTDQGWTIPKHIPSIPVNNWSPYLSPDANSIYFSLAYLNQSNKFNRFNLFRCNRTPGGWNQPQELGPPLSSSGAEWGFSLAADNSFYFSSTRKGGRGGDDIWYSPFVDNTWSRAIHLSALNTGYNDAGPGIAPDESFMVFNSIKPGGLGGADLYLTLRRPDGTWTAPKNLGAKVNSIYHDFCAHITADKKYLFFTRRTGGNPNRDAADIYWVALKEYLPESHR
ncbi:MAG: PHB depolymerase family esterase [Planctomycetota bacterium]